MTISASGLRHGVRARLLEPVAYILGYVLIGVGGTMTAAAGVGLLHSEFTEATWIGVAAASTVVTGCVLARKIVRPAPRDDEVARAIATGGAHGISAARKNSLMWFWIILLPGTLRPRFQVGLRKPR